MRSTPESLETARRLRGDEPNADATQSVGAAAATAQEFLNCEDAAVAAVYVPPLGKHVYVKLMTALERDRFEEAWQKRSQGGQTVAGFRACLVTHTACDSQGNLLFDAHEENDLQQKSARMLEPIVNKAMEVNGLSEEDQETMVGNSSGGASADSPTDSR
jgi:hypothetical protein